jgi:ribonucleoside-diphosphate reductase alpha chain
MGTPFIYERGSMSLYNCGYTEIGDDVASDVGWLMDSLMLGVGIGFYPIRNDSMELHHPTGQCVYVIPDSREGWVEATARLINSYVRPNQRRVKLVYDEVRPAGLPIRGFGGVSSGPGPLMELHEQVRSFCERFKERKYYDSVHLKADIANCVGCCVVAGNVRRSAELLMAPIKDRTFLDLKDYEKFPDRAAHGWMSNNSAKLVDDEDFDRLGEVAYRVPIRGEPGIANLRNFPYGRIGKKKNKSNDRATGLNPCGEITLENKELCNVAETLPTMCSGPENWYRSCEQATMYMSTVSLLPTHQQSTNAVIARNRRIGCSIIDVSGWKHVHGVHKVTRWLREGYKIVRETNKKLNQEAGVPPAIKVTTIKPGGTTPKLAGRTPGIGHPTYVETLRRIRIGVGSPVDRFLMAESGLPWEMDLVSQNTRIYEYPIIQLPAKPADKVSLWEQAMNLVWMQREWADNSVSNTLYFKPKWELVASEASVHDLEELLDEVEFEDYVSSKEVMGIFAERKVVAATSGKYNVYVYNKDHEEDDIEAVLSCIAPLVKSASFLPHSAKGVYNQMPEEGLSKEEYERRLSALRPIPWHKLSGSDGVDEKYCDSSSCEAAT